MRNNNTVCVLALLLSGVCVAQGTPPTVRPGDTLRFSVKLPVFVRSMQVIATSDDCPDIVSSSTEYPDPKVKTVVISFWVPPDVLESAPDGCTYKAASFTFEGDVTGVDTRTEAIEQNDHKPGDNYRSDSNAELDELNYSHGDGAFDVHTFMVTK